MDRTISENVRNVIQFDGVVALFDQSDYEWPYQRYLPYRFFPEARFVVGIYRFHSGFTVSVGRNPWARAPAIHIGRLCEQWGGGGHQAVAGITFEDAREARSVAESIAADLRSMTEDSASKVGPIGAKQ